MAKEGQVTAVTASSTILPDGKTLVAFLVFVAVSGSASVAIRFTYAEMPPVWSGAVRFICGSGFSGFGRW